MATLDLTLAALRIAGVRNFSPAFGTKEADDVGLTTKSMMSNYMLPFQRQRPIEVNENSVTTEIQADSRLLMTNSGTTLELGAAVFAGCRVEISAGFASGSANIAFETAGGTETLKLAPNAGVILLADANLKWKVFL